MSSSDLVQSALFTMLVDVLTGKTVQWPNKKFLPPSDALWFRVIYMPVDRGSRTLGELGEDQEDGLVQIDVNVPTDSGEKVQREALDMLEKRFTAGEVAAYSDQEVSIIACKRSPGRDVDGFYRVSLTVEYYARIQRPPLTT